MEDSPRVVPSGASHFSASNSTVDILWTNADIISLLLDDGDISSDSSSDSSDWSLPEDDYTLPTARTEDSFLTDVQEVRNRGSVVVPSRYRGAAQHLSEEEFFEEFRINRKLVDSLAEKFRESSFFEYHATGKQKALSAYDHLLVFLWFAGHRVTFRTTSEQFGISNCSVYKVIQRVMGFLMSIAESVMSWPNEEEMKTSAEYFRLKGIPFTIGAIALDHIGIDKLVEEGYFNQERNIFSVPFQVVCDQRKCIRHVYIDARGSDDYASSVFENSKLKEDLEHLCAHYVILGDHKFPCLRNLLTPYRGSLVPKKKLFNYLLSQGRTPVVQGCLKRLKIKFPQLTHCKLRIKGDISQFIIACCVLHNLSVDDQFLQNVGNSSLRPNADGGATETDSSDTNDTPEGLEYRDDLLTAVSISRNWR